MVAPEPLVICSKTLQNALFSVQHPQNRVWGPTCEHSGPKNTVLSQKMAFFWPFLAKKCVFLVMEALKPLIVCYKTLQKIFFETSTLKIGYGALQLTTPSPKTLF